MSKLYFNDHINEDDLQWKMTSNGRQPSIEDDLKIVKVEYLSNHLLGHTQILKLGLDDQTIFYKFLKQRRPSMEDDFNACRI